MYRLAFILAILAFSIGTSPVHAQEEEPTGATEFEPGSPSYEHLEGRGFYRRRAKGTGWFVTRRDPVFARSYRLADVLRTAPGVSVVERGGRTLLVSSRAYGECAMAVFSDGLYTTFRSLDDLAIEHIAALEVYRGPAEVPYVFNAPSYDRTCGALVVWTRIELDEEG